jgi:hypothetical protein
MSLDLFWLDYHSSWLTILSKGLNYIFSIRMAVQQERTENVSPQAISESSSRDSRSSMSSQMLATREIQALTLGSTSHMA